MKFNYKLFKLISLMFFCVVNLKIYSQHLDKNNLTKEPTYSLTPINSSFPNTQDCYCYYYNDFNDYHSYINSFIFLSLSASIRNEWYREQKDVISNELIERLHLDPDYAHNYSYDYLQTIFFSENFGVPVANLFY